MSFSVHSIKLNEIRIRVLLKIISSPVCQAINQRIYYKSNNNKMTHRLPSNNPHQKAPLLVCDCASLVAYINIIFMTYKREYIMISWNNWLLLVSLTFYAIYNVFIWNANIILLSIPTLAIE